MHSDLEPPSALIFDREDCPSPRPDPIHHHAPRAEVLVSHLFAPTSMLLAVFALGCTDHGLKIHEAEPKASLLSPGDNETFLEGSAVAFRVQLDDNDDGVSALEVAWRSDTMGTLRGEATVGDDNVQEFVTRDLENGTHVVTVTATDPDGNTASDDVAIIVSPNSAPQVGLTAVFAGDFTAYGVGDDAVIVATVADGEDDPEALRLTWAINGVPDSRGPDAAEPTGEAVWILSGLEAGDYTVSANVLDSLGSQPDAGAATVDFSIVPLDGDGDGTTTGELGGEDCDDTDPDIGPGADEVCDGIDNDCDGLIDAEDDDILDVIEGHPDADGDGYGDDATTVLTCDLTDLSDVGGDCNDSDEAVNPGALEVCGDGLDNDCDGTSGPCKWTGDNLITTANHLSTGVYEDDALASSMTGGDVNGDGIDDLLIGSIHDDDDLGALYVVHGPLTETFGAANAHASAAVYGTEEMSLGAAVAVGDLQRRRRRGHPGGTHLQPAGRGLQRGSSVHLLRRSGWGRQPRRRRPHHHRHRRWRSPGFHPLQQRRHRRRRPHGCHHHEPHRRLLRHRQRRRPSSSVSTTPPTP